MKKQTSKFIHEFYYEHSDRSPQNGSIVLEIDYLSKKFDIKSSTLTNGHFGFINTSHEWRRWKAVAKAIDECIDFAVKELELEDAVAIKTTQDK